ncbi:MAG TPA: phospholipid carrier-dependent glycosyltransferase [Polyangia bacterium]
MIPLRRPPRDLPLYLVLGAMTVLGVYLRLHDCPGTSQLRWDEHHYLNVARSYLTRTYATDDHPPFGKLIITGAMRLFGDTPIGWRIASLVFGFANIGLCAWVAEVVWKRGRAALLAGAFVAADGFFIAYSRAALLDGMIVAFAMAGIATLLSVKSWRQVVVAALLLGGAGSFKLNGVTFICSALVICAVTRRLRPLTPLLALVAAGVFYAQHAFALALTGHSATIPAVIAENRKLIAHHLSYTVVNPNSSHWYTWFLPWKPIFLRRDVDPVTGSIKALITLGNPLLWWGATAAVVATAVVAIRVGWRRLWPELRDAAPSPAAGPPAPDGPLLALESRAGVLCWVLLVWAAPVAFWVPNLRDAYLYHYLPSYTFALVLLAGLVDRLYTRWPLPTLIGLAAVLEVSLFYAPLWSELPLSENALNARLFPLWR